MRERITVMTNLTREEIQRLKAVADKKELSITGLATLTLRKVIQREYMRGGADVSKDSE